MESSISEAVIEKREARLKHMRSVVKSSVVAELLSAANNRTGDTAACILLLSQYAMANAMIAWFDDHDTQAMKNWWHTFAYLRKTRYEMIGPEKINVGEKFLELIGPLLSDDDNLIRWYSNTDFNFDLDRIEDHKTHDFWAYQAMVALRGDWPRLISRCERVLADPPKASKEQKYLIDHRFYLALAQGDNETMSNVIQQLVTPKVLAARRNYEKGFTSDFISTPAVIFSKLAWRSGFHIDTKSPFIPTEWLTVDPLPQYKEYYCILQ